VSDALFAASNGLTEAVALLETLGIEQAHWVGNSQGGQSSMVAAITHSKRVRKFVMGGSHKRRPRQAGGVVFALRGQFSLCDDGERIRVQQGRG
jgi:pimeloyl-ACP methyl ester carboxylesterase